MDGRAEQPDTDVNGPLRKSSGRVCCDAQHRYRSPMCSINPVKHGLVTRVCDWPFSSFHRDVAAGLFSQDWAGEFETLGEFGEARVAQ